MDLVRQELHAGFARRQTITDNNHIRGTFEERVAYRRMRSIPFAEHCGEINHRAALFASMDYREKIDQHESN